MTGTALTSKEEFQKVYNLDVAVIPTHKPMIRHDFPDSVYQTEKGKWTAVVRKIKELYGLGRPILVGTVSIEKNEKLSFLLKKEGIKHELLNAKNHEREGEIIAQAGRKGSVTIATNMAGRGVDIILGGNPPIPEEAQVVRELGGLFVLGTERHEARRIDNQLRGRSGRQGDSGSTQFFVSLEDDLLRVFASEKLKRLMGTFGIREDEPIESKMVSRSIESAQTKIEGFHFDTRKHLLEYDDVLSRQRTSVYKSRREMLMADETRIKKSVDDMLESFAQKVVDAHIHGVQDNWMREELAEVVMSVTNIEGLREKIVGMDNREEIKNIISETFKNALLKRIEKEQEHFYETARLLYLQIIDYLWHDHLEIMEHTRSSVRLRAYGQHDPLVEYKNEAVRLFRTFHEHLNNLFTQNILKAVDQEFSTHKGPLKRIAPPPPALVSARSGVSVSGQQQTVSNVSGAAGRKKIGRNDPCPCGSGKKYKRCHAP